jgi:hypothetical protein
VCKDSAGAQKSESFKDSGAKLRRSNVLYAQARTQVAELAEKRRTKVEAFEHLKFFQVWEEKRQGSAGAIAVVGSAEKIWTVEGFHIQEAVQEERTGEMI